MFTFVSTTGLVASAALPSVLSALEIPLPFEHIAQFGGMGLFGYLLWWDRSKTLPTMQKDNREALVEITKQHNSGLEKLANQVEGLRKDIREDNHLNREMLKAVIFKNMGS